MSQIITVTFAFLLFLNYCQTEEDQNKFASVKSLLDEGPLQALLVPRIGNRNRTQCAIDAAFLAASLKESWALEMMDANGKFPYGLMKGNTFSLGQFDQCLSIEHRAQGRTIKGKYCPIDVDVPNMLRNETREPDAKSATIVQINPTAGDGSRFDLVMGACVPSSCSAAQITSALQQRLNGLNISAKTLVRGADRFCSESGTTEELSRFQIIGIAFFTAVALVMILSTAYDVLTRFWNVEKKNSHRVLVSFSMYTNTIKLTEIGQSSDNLKCLHGIRVLSLFWIVLMHRYSHASSMPLDNSEEFKEWDRIFSSMPIHAGGLAVDSFFVLSGFLLAYSFCGKHENKKSFSVRRFYLHRFVRIWPAMAAAVLFIMTIFPLLGHAPLWKVTREAFADKCEAGWWTNLLFLHNYVLPHKMCMHHTWFLAADMQLYLLSPLLLWQILKSKEGGMACMLCWIFGSQMIVVMVVYANNWGVFNNAGGGYWNGYYVVTHVRGAVWFWGFFGGYLLHSTKNKPIKLEKAVVAILWIISFGIIYFIIFGAFPWIQLDHKINKLQDGTFNAFARSAWSLNLIWIIFACLKGYGGPINRFLSLPMWEVLGRLSYSMYLLHLYVQFVHLGNMKVVPHFSNFQQTYAFFGDLLSSMIISYFWLMAFEYPFSNIESALLHRGKSDRVRSNGVPKTVENESKTSPIPENCQLMDAEKMSQNIHIEIFKCK